MDVEVSHVIRYIRISEYVYFEVLLGLQWDLTLYCFSKDNIVREHTLKAYVGVEM
jgi:hypothetical protein